MSLQISRRRATINSMLRCIEGSRARIAGVSALKGRMRLLPAYNRMYSSQGTIFRHGATRVPLLVHQHDPASSPYVLRALHTSVARQIHTTPSPRTSKVTIELNDEQTNFSALLLRDLCQCPSCVHESTNQRLYSTADIPSSIQANSVETTPDSVKLTWSQDVPNFPPSHTTTISLSTLRSIAATGSRPVPHQASLEPQVLWGAKDPLPPDTTFAAYLEDDVALYNVMQQLRQHGLVFITDIPRLEDALEKIAKRMGPMKDTFYGYTWDVKTVPSAINAAYTSSDLGFHTDLLYFDSPPHIQLLHCIESAASGGASVFADAFKAAADLYEEDERAFDVLSNLSVNYHYHHPEDNVYFTTKRVFEFDEEYLRKHAGKKNKSKVDIVKGLEKINWGPPFMAPFSLTGMEAESGVLQGKSLVEMLDQKIADWHWAARKFSALLHRPEALFERLMKPGECVLFDNTRVLHARRGFDAADVGKRRWLKGGYVDKDPWLSRYRVLRGRFGA